MPVAPLFHVPENRAEFEIAAFVNYDHHVQVSNWIAVNRNLEIARFVLDPLPPDDNLGAWILNHQSWHAQIDAVLGVRSYNLLGLDPGNQDVLAAWVFLHATEHRVWGQITGLA